jgi:hypothetical protein
MVNLIIMKPQSTQPGRNQLPGKVPASYAAGRFLANEGAFFHDDTSNMIWSIGEALLMTGNDHLDQQ